MCFRITQWPILISLVIATIVPISAFSKADESLSVLLNDALYSLNRYEELVGGVSCASWKAPENLRHICADEIRHIGANVDGTKITLARAMKARSPSLVDLLDIGNELGEIAGHLEELGNNVSDYHGENGIAFSQLRNRLLILEQRCQDK
jgi:hypothetical protein